MDSEILIVSFLIGTDKFKSDFTTPLALHIGKEVSRKDLYVDFTQLSIPHFSRTLSCGLPDLNNCDDLSTKNDNNIEIINLD